MATRGYFVTGTDTGIGKTRISVALLHLLRSRGLRAIGMKPIASGCVMTEQGWRNEDALQLRSASDPRPDYELVNPFALPEATAPTIAARRSGIRVELPSLVAAYRALQAQADAVVVEGVGGWLAPLAEGLEQSDLVRALHLDVVLVVGLRLGCINHARLTERAIQHDGAGLVGWIANAVDGTLDFADEYFRELEAAMATPCLGRVRHSPGANDVDGSVFLSGMP